MSGINRDWDNREVVLHELILERVDYMRAHPNALHSLAENIKRVFIPEQMHTRLINLINDSYAFQGAEARSFQTLNSSTWSARIHRALWNRVNMNAFPLLILGNIKHYRMDREKQLCRNFVGNIAAYAYRNGGDERLCNQIFSAVSLGMLKEKPITVLFFNHINDDHIDVDGEKAEAAEDRLESVSGIIGAKIPAEDGGDSIFKSFFTEDTPQKVISKICESRDVSTSLQEKGRKTAILACDRLGNRFQQVAGNKFVLRRRLQGRAQVIYTDFSGHLNATLRQIVSSYPLFRVFDYENTQQILPFYNEVVGTVRKVRTIESRILLDHCRVVYEGESSPVFTLSDRIFIDISSELQGLQEGFKGVLVSLPNTGKILQKLQSTCSILPQERRSLFDMDPTAQDVKTSTLRCMGVYPSSSSSSSSLDIPGQIYSFTGKKLPQLRKDLFAMETRIKSARGPEKIQLKGAIKSLSKLITEKQNAALKHKGLDKRAAGKGKKGNKKK